MTTPQTPATNSDSDRLKFCWSHAIESFGTAYIFERRRKWPKRMLRLVAFLGIAVPASFGAVVLSFGNGGRAVPWLAWVAGLLGLLQVILSVWSLAGRWEDTLSYYRESVRNNTWLSNQYVKLAKFHGGDFFSKAEVLDTAFDARVASDMDYDVSDSEKRRGLRAALRQFQRECVGCKEVPTSMLPTSCPICGDF
jgi:mobilome CxxCx(11)CxxC protein